MPRADLPVETATSFAAVGLEADDDRLLADYLAALDEQLAALAAAGGDAAAAGVLGEVEALCTTIGSDVVGVAARRDRARGPRAADRRRRPPRGRAIAAAYETAVSAGDVVHVR